MRFSLRELIMILTIVGMALAIALQHRQHRKTLSETPVVVAMHDLHEGDFLTEDDIAFTYATPKGEHTERSIGEIVGKSLPREINKNERIPLNELTELGIKNSYHRFGYRLVALEYDVSKYQNRTPRKGEIVQVETPGMDTLLVGEVFNRGVWIREVDHDLLLTAQTKSQLRFSPLSIYSLHELPAFNSLVASDEPKPKDE